MYRIVLKIEIYLLNGYKKLLWNKKIYIQDMYLSCKSQKKTKNKKESRNFERI